MHLIKLKDMRRGEFHHHACSARTQTLSCQSHTQTLGCLRRVPDEIKAFRGTRDFAHGKREIATKENWDGLGNLRADGRTGGRVGLVCVCLGGGGGGG